MIVAKNETKNTSSRKRARLKRLLAVSISISVSTADCIDRRQSEDCYQHDDPAYGPEPIWQATGRPEFENGHDPGCQDGIGDPYQDQSNDDPYN
jgi:hypothetical protein